VTEPSEQLGWEARWAKPAAYAAFAYALLTVAGSVYVGLGLDTQPEDTRELLAALDSQSNVFMTSVVVQAVGLLLLPLPLVYLYGAVKARRPELLTIALYLAVAGPLLLALASVLSQMDRIDNAEQFLASGPQTEDRAKDLVVERSGLGLGLGLAGSMAFGIALVLLGVNAMRAGVLNRFMGVLGVIVGALPVLSALIPLVSAGFVQLFWVTALGFLFLDKWPGGRGPAWETGEATPWPSAADRRLEQVEAPAEGSPREDPRPAEATPQKRKRKRKR
jgi:hypothetical protein